MNKANLPALPLDEWEDTKITLHLMTQMVGKVRLGLTPRLNHWWHVPFYVSSRGITSSAIPYAGGSFEMEFDFIAHHLTVRTSMGQTKALALENTTIAEFYRGLLDTLESLGIHTRIHPRPFDPARVKSDIPFAEDTAHHHYDREYVEKFWHILLEIDPVFRKFRGRFLGKSSPVHFFWHSFDLAASRFSGKAVEVGADADPVTKDAYSHEVISAGFWVGDDNLREPAFYSYTYPEPPDLRKQPLRPKAASWQDQNGGAIAVLRYEDVRRAENPEAMLLDFLQSTYEAGANLSGWPRPSLETPA